LNHTFIVELKTCTACHLEELHAGKQTSASAAGTEDDHAPQNPIIIDAMASGTTAGVNQLPRGANPIQFAAFVGLILIGIGLTLGPSLRKWLPRLLNKGAIDE
jgi:hypothetical protein